MERVAMKELQVFGTGCPKHRKLAEHAESAAEQLGLAYDVERVTHHRGIARR